MFVIWSKWPSPCHIQYSCFPPYNTTTNPELAVFFILNSIFCNSWVRLVKSNLNKSRHLVFSNSVSCFFFPLVQSLWGWRAILGFYAVGEQPASCCKSPVPKCFARLVAARCGITGQGLLRWSSSPAAPWSLTFFFFYAGWREIISGGQQ